MFFPCMSPNAPSVSEVSRREILVVVRSTEARYVMLGASECNERVMRRRYIIKASMYFYEIR